MNRIGVVCAMSCLALAGPLWAAIVRPGGDPPCERILWADPFDHYTQWAWDNKDNPAYPKGTMWTGGPIPAGAVDTDATPLRCDDLFPKVVTPPVEPNCGDTSWQNFQTIPSKNEMARANWVSNNCGPITSPYFPTATNQGGVVAAPGMLDIEYGGGTPRDGKCYDSGRITETNFMLGWANYTWGTGGSYDSMPQFTFDLTDRIQAMATARNEGTKNAVNGTDENPLTLFFHMRSGSYNNNEAPWNNSYVELSLGDETAPTDYVWRGNPVAPPKGVNDPEYCPQGPFPIICQQVREINTGECTDGGDLVWLSNACPAVVPPYNPETGTGKTWRSIAFGLMAIMDHDPCKSACSTAHIPTNDHWAVFDGNKWRQIRNGRYPGLDAGFNTWPFEANMALGGGSCNNFVTQGGETRVYMKIITDYILIYARSFDSNNSPTDWHAAVPRIYKGGFNKIRWGVGPGCELDKATGECKVGGTPKQCLTYTQANGAGYKRTMMDTIGLLDGQLEYVDTINGACCDRTDGSCSITDQLTCESNPDARFDGVGSACGDFRCCPTQYGDTDADGDVDMDDFAVLQRCITTGGPAVSDDPRCECLDSENDGDIDGDDVTHFAACASGTAGDANPACMTWQVLP